MKKAVNIILGPTSTGKTSLAVKLCKQFGGEIISADSRQIYKGMDVGTGKVPINLDFKIDKNDEFWLVDGIKVWGYDLVNPDEYFSAYDFASWALPKAETLLKEDKNVFLVGGTGFFIDFFTARVKPSKAPPDFNLRKTLEKLSLPELQRKLTSLNLEAFENIDQNNPARLIRAIEVKMNKHLSPTPLPYLKNVAFNFVGFSTDREVLYKRADNWLEEIWPSLLDETKNLIDAGYSQTRPLNGLVYKTVKEFLEAKDSEEDFKQQAKYDLHHYIRRQVTYFRKNKDIKWFDISNPDFSQEVAKHVQNRVESN